VKSILLGVLVSIPMVLGRGALRQAVVPGDERRALAFRMASKRILKAVITVDCWHYSDRPER